MNKKYRVSIDLDRDKFIKYYEDGATINDLQMIFGCTKYIVNKHIKKFNLRKHNNQSSKMENLIYPNNAEKAYLLGYLIHKIKPLYQNEIFGYRIVWNEKEEDIMSMIFNVYGITSNTYYDKVRNEYFKILYDIRFFNQLYYAGFRFNYGFINNPIKSSYYNLDFIRGYIDGGFGVISSDSKFPYIQIKGGYNFLRYILGICKIYGVKTFKRNKKDYFQYIRFTGQKLCEFLSKIYYDGCLYNPDNLVKVNKIYRKLKYKKR